MASRDIPPRWAERLIERGFTDRRRTKGGGPSASALADEIGVHTSTVSAAFHGDRTTDPEVIEAIVGALGPDVRTWLTKRDDHGPYTPPAAARYLGSEEREAVDKIIKLLAREQPESRAGSHPADPPADEDAASQRLREQAETLRRTRKAKKSEPT